MKKNVTKFSRLFMMAFMLIVLLTAAAANSVAVAEEAVPQTREYNQAFDRLLDNGKGSGSQAAYRSIVWAEGQCDDVTEPIFKIGSPKISAGFETLNIELRSPDESVKLSDIMIGLRISDSDAVAAENSYLLSDEEVIGGITFSAGEDIGSEWSTLTIDFTQTDIRVNGAAFDSTVPDAMLGFHLFAAETSAGGSLDIRRIFVTAGASETVVLNFDNVNESWWYQSESGTYRDYPACYSFTDSKVIASDASSANNLDGAYSAIVLSIAGSGNITVAPVNENGETGEAKAWSDLTDLNGTPLAAVGSGFQNAVISLESLGMVNIKGVCVSVEGGQALVSGAFFTNMEDLKPDESFPQLDVSSIAYMTQFGFEYLTAGADYDKAVEDCAPFNCDYILSYSAENCAITNGHLVLDAQGQSYVNMKIRSKVASEGRRYLVFKYKLTDGATLNEFRFDVLTTDGDVGVGIKYAAECYAGIALSSVSDINPYEGNNGYQYLIVDLELTFGERYISGVDVYFGGAGQMLIDEIYYVHPVTPEMNYSENILSEAMTLNVSDGSDYCYLGGMDLDGAVHDGMEIVMRGSEGYTLNEVRIEMGGSTAWFVNNDSGTFYDVYGRFMPVLSVENQVYTIDFEKSGITGALENMHIHATGVAGGAQLIIESIRYIDYAPEEMQYTEEVLAEDFAGREFIAAAPGYAYIGYVNGASAADSQFMVVEVEGDISLLRFEFVGIGTYWITENDQGTLRDENGNTFPVSGAQTLVIDLGKSGITGTVGDIHIHNEFAAAGDVLRITSVKFASYAENSEIIVLPENDDSAPEITGNIPSSGTVGEEISVSASAEDNYGGEVSIEFEVTLGSETIIITNGKFTPEKAGTYSVKVIATDEAGNSDEQVFSIVVSDAEIPECTEHVDEDNDGKCDICGKDMPSENEPEDPDGPAQTEGPGAGLYIVIGLVLIVAAVIIFYVVKKKNKKNS